MAITIISLPDDQLARLRQHAHASQRSLAEVVRAAVDAYLVQLPGNGVGPGNEPLAAPTDPGWHPVTKMTPDGVHLRIPPAMTPGEAEALASQPTPEARRKYLAAWLGKRGAHVIEPPNDIPDEEWQARFDAVTERIRQAGPTDLTHEEIEALITEVSAEVRRELATNGTGDHRTSETVKRPFSPESQAEIDAALARLRSTVPADLTPEEIDAEIDAAWQEVRQERRARLGLND